MRKDCESGGHRLTTDIETDDLLRVVLFSDLQKLRRLDGELLEPTFELIEKVEVQLVKIGDVISPPNTPSWASNRNGRRSLAGKKKEPIVQNNLPEEESVSFFLFPLAREVLLALARACS